MKRMIEGLKVMSLAIVISMGALVIIFGIAEAAKHWPGPTVALTSMALLGLLSYLIGWGLE